MRKAISIVLKVITIPFTLLGIIFVVRLAEHCIHFSKEHAADYDLDDPKELKQLGTDGAMTFYYDLAMSE